MSSAVRRSGPIADHRVRRVLDLAQVPDAEIAPLEQVLHVGAGLLQREETSVPPKRAWVTSPSVRGVAQIARTRRKRSASPNDWYFASGTRVLATLLP